ncbi:unnamed protein product [Gadus morhua 'NCC']
MARPWWCCTTSPPHPPPRLHHTLHPSPNPTPCSSLETEVDPIVSTLKGVETEVWARVSVYVTTLRHKRYITTPSTAGSKNIPGVPEKRPLT